MVIEGAARAARLWFGHGSWPPRPGQARLVLRNVTKLVRICQTALGGEGTLVLCRTRSASHGGRLKVPGAEDLSQSGTSATVWPMSWLLLAAETERGVDWCQVLQVSWRKLAQAVASCRAEHNEVGRRGSKNNGRPRVWLPTRPPSWPWGGGQRERNLAALQAHRQAPAHLGHANGGRVQPSTRRATPIARVAGAGDQEQNGESASASARPGGRWQVLGSGGHRLQVAGHHHPGWRPKAGAPSAQIASLQLRISICPGPRVHGNRLPGPPPSPTVPRRLAGELGGRAGGPGRGGLQAGTSFPSQVPRSRLCQSPRASGMALPCTVSSPPGPSCKSGVRVTMPSPPRVQVLAAQGHPKGTPRAPHSAQHACMRATPAALARPPTGPCLRLFPLSRPARTPSSCFTCDHPPCRSFVMLRPFTRSTPDMCVFALPARGNLGTLLPSFCQEPPIAVARSQSLLV